MAIRQIPIDPGVSAFTFKVDLDNRPFQFRFTFNIRMALWLMDVFDDAGTELIRGVAVHVKQLLLQQFKHDLRLPQGELFALNLVSENENPSVDNFGGDVVMLYRDEAD